MLNLSAYPQCAKRLHFQRANLADEAMNAFWAAACVADEFTDAALVKFGGFDFDDRSEENGYRQLARLEQLMASRKAKDESAAFIRRQEAEQKDIRERAKALLGSNGVKVSRLVSDDEYWQAASILWPGHVSKPDVATLPEFIKQVSAIGKKVRPKMARENLKRLPARWISEKVSA